MRFPVRIRFVRSVPPRSPLHPHTHPLRGAALHCLLGLAALLAACSSAGVPDPGGTPGGGDPDPAPVAAVLDASRAASATVPLAGGTLEATAEDGTRFTLTVPADALLEPTTITLTPVRALDGFELDGAVLHGVDLKPDGLLLYRDATLTIEPPGGARREALPLALSGAPHELHLQPMRPDPDTLAFDLQHFSVYVVALGDGVTVRIDPDTLTPEQAAALLEHAMGELLMEERQRQLNGEGGDPEFGTKVVAILDEYYDRSIVPLLPAIAAGCEGLEAHIGTALGFLRQLALMGALEENDPRNQAVMDAMVQGLQNCLQQTAEPCIDTGNPQQIAEILGLMRAMELLGISTKDSPYNPLDPEQQCEPFAAITLEYTETSTWDETPLQASGTVRFVFEEHGSRNKDRFRATGSGTYIGMTGYQLDGLPDDDKGCIGSWSGTWVHEIQVEVDPEGAAGDGPVPVRVYLNGPQEGTLDLTLDGGCVHDGPAGFYLPWQDSGGFELLLPPGVTRGQARNDTPDHYDDELLRSYDVELRGYLAAWEAMRPR